MTGKREARQRAAGAAPLPIAAVAAFMALAAAALNVSPTAPLEHIGWSFIIWAGILALAFWLVETVPIHLEWAGQAYSMSLSEVPLVLGLFFCPTSLLVAARVIGGGIALACSRKQPPHKLAFNVALQSLEVSLALVVFATLHGTAGNVPMDKAWVALLAVMAASLVSTSAVCVAVRLSVGVLESSVLVSFLRSGLFALLVNTSIALVLATALKASPAVAMPMLIMLLAAAVVYRAYVTLRQRHSGLEMLYQFTSGLNQTSTTEHRIRDILTRTRGMLKSGTAGLLLLGSDNEPPMMRWIREDDVLHAVRYAEHDSDGPFKRVVEDGDVVVIARTTRSTAEQEFLTNRDFRDAVIAPLLLDGQVRGALYVADREGDVASFTDDDGRLFQTVAAQVSSVLDNSRLLDRLTHDSLHDALTGLANRQCFQGRLRTALAAARPDAAVMLTDLDRFKEINDTLGHHHGDLLIREIAARIAETAPAIATVARLGGDEFALLVPGLDAEGAVALARRIRDAIKEPCTLDGVSVEVDASIGISVAPDHGTDDSVLLKRADMAMYAAKSAHTGVELYDRERDEYSPRRLALASRLRTAIESGEMLLHYQPQTLAATGQVVGAEALIRWQHPEYGLVPPMEFVPIAEQSGAIGQLTQWVLETAVSQLAEWRRQGLEISVSVNASMRNLLDPDMAERLTELMSHHGIPPGSLTIEITETHLMSDPGRTLPLLHRLAAHGVRLSVDDFGTGYSSLSYLNDLPVHEVKIDKSFVLVDGESRRNDAIVRAIVSMSHHLGLETVAEGVEDASAERALAALGCTRLQGYHIARPMPAADFTQWMATHGLPVQRSTDRAGYARS
jgi:diguanylate cyclase (GGDEF)-like protein